MFGKHTRKARLFHDGMRAERAIVYGGQVWSFVILILILAALTSPLWLISPPATTVSKQDIRLAGVTFWSALALLALFAGRSWGVRINLNRPGKTVSRERCSPWKVETIWSHSGDRISYVSLSANPQGIARLEAWLKDGSTLLIEKSVNQESLRALGTEIARCWEVPFKE